MLMYFKYLNIYKYFIYIYIYIFYFWCKKWKECPYQTKVFDMPLKKKADEISLTEKNPQPFSTIKETPISRICKFRVDKFKGATWALKPQSCSLTGHPHRKRSAHRPVSPRVPHRAAVLSRQVPRLTCSETSFGENTRARYKGASDN